MTDPGLSAEQVIGIDNLADALNEELRAAGAGSAELAFGLGCGVGIVPVAVIVLMLFIFDVVNLILAFFLLLIFFLALAGVAAILAFQARKNSTDRVYRESVGPQIDAHLQKFGLTRQQFDAHLYSQLSDGAPLRAYLSPEEPEESIE